jgi:hypothetical protein
MTKTGTCCLCGHRYTLYGNNPWPLSTVETDRCCRKCDDERVIPERLRLFRAEQTNAALKIKKAEQIYTQADVSTDIANYLKTCGFDSLDDLLRDANGKEKL